MANRRRRHPEGFMMRELDGVGLTDSDIFLNYRILEEKGYLRAKVVNNDLTLLLTPKGNDYCIMTLYPSLSVAEGEELDLAAEPSSTKPTDLKYDNDDFEGQDLFEIWNSLPRNVEALLQLAQIDISSKDIPDHKREFARKALFRFEELTRDLDLSNEERANLATWSKVVMVLFDAPISDRKDSANFLLKMVNLLLRKANNINGEAYDRFVMTASLIVATLTYLGQN